MAKIMIDPGHAPGNPNRGKNGYYEYAGMWKLSGFLKKALERCGHTVGLSRKENQDPLLTQRGGAAKGYDLFISEHSNAGGGRGCECYYSVRIPNDKRFAVDLAKAVSAVLGSNSRGAKVKKSTHDPIYDYYTVIAYAVYAGCPHVFLCENGFHDNDNDCAILNTDAGLQNIAETQARVICEHIGGTYIPASLPDEPAKPIPSPQPKPEQPTPTPTTLAVGDRVRIRDGVTTFADGTGMASFVRSATLYVRQIGSGKVLISTQPSGAVTGWVRTGDIVREDGNAVAPAPKPEPVPEPAKPVPAPTPTALAVGDRVRIRDGVTTFADGTGMASFVRSVTLYVRKIGSGKVLISTQPSGAVTGWVRTGDIVREDGNAVAPAPEPKPKPAPKPAPTPTALAVGDRVRIQDGVTTFADGTGMASFVRSATLYVRQIGNGKVLISTQASGAVTGWVKSQDVIKV